MHRFIKYCFEEKPLLFCIWAGFFFRLLAVIFANGMAFGYDHFIYIEDAQLIASGKTTLHDYIFSDKGLYFARRGHSLIYFCFNIALLYLCELVNIYDPSSKIFIMKLLHGMLSIIVIYYSYRITYRIANRKAALAIGILTSMLWFIPFVSVKNLPENIAALITLAAVYRLAKTRTNTYKFADDIFTGFLMGAAASFCYNMTIFIIGTIICYIIKSGPKRGFMILFGATISILAFEGIFDIFMLNYPFYVISEYIHGILSGSNVTYGAKSLYMYISILVMVIPLPWGSAAIFGYAKSWKHCFLIFFPTTFYIVVSYLLPNKEEKFMLSILPLYMILCVSGWYRYIQQSRFWISKTKMKKIFNICFFAINTPILLLSSTAYLRRPQLESMIYLSKYKSEIKSIFVESSQTFNAKRLPLYYLGKNVELYLYFKPQDTVKIDPSIYYCSTSDNINDYEHLIFTEKYFKNSYNSDRFPQYVLLYGNSDTTQRLAKLRDIFPQLTHEVSFSRSLGDILVEFANKSNDNMDIHIYKTE